MRDSLKESKVCATWFEIVNGGFLALSNSIETKLVYHINALRDILNLEMTRFCAPGLQPLHPVANRTFDQSQ